MRAGLVTVLLLGTALAGCTMGDSGTAGRAGVSLDMAAGGAIERDVEAPEVFNMEEAGLWDGRPSLGGVWVAHPGADDPERVLIRNAGNGETVIGALFRRERDNPGPRFQVSSEAANALGILPGAPTTIRVVALRLEQVRAAPEAQPEPAPVPPEQVAGTAADADLTAGAAPAPGSVAGQVEITATESGQSAPRRGLLGALFGRNEAPAVAAPAITESALAPVTPEAVQQGTPVQEQPLTAAAGQPPRQQPQPQARANEARGLRGLFSRRQAEPVSEPLTALAAAPSAPGSAASPPAPARAASTLAQPFVQIGIFSVETNATGARNQMQAAGLNAEIRQGRASGRDFWRVVVGPASDSTARAQMLERVRAMGFSDAYAVVR
ncbi:MAG TPA: hypothetical protein GX700_01125 [Paracoccus sp.]|nr:hypothetical protein [Paracoccus sp. (in: a-proteobacteria)]